MEEAKKYLSLLQVTVPPATPLPVSAEIRILCMLGIVSDPEYVRAIELTSALIPPDTIATLHALIKFLVNIIKDHPITSKKDKEDVVGELQKLDDVPDAQLNYGTFLSICESLVTAMDTRRRLRKGEGEEEEGRGRREH